MRPALEDLVVHAVVAEVVAFRIVQSGSPQDPAVLDGLRSNYDRGIAPRGAEASSALIHMGLSMYQEQSRAIDIAQRWPRIGGYVAEMHLRPEHGIWFAATGEPGHLTVWGRQLQLLACVADILEVDQP
jgi:hypothetical protein